MGYGKLMDTMSTSALDAATIDEIEAGTPGGGGPGDEGPDGGGGGGGDGDSEENRRRRSLYRIGTLLTMASVAMLFGALVLVFWFRSKSIFLWQPVATPRALWISTVVLGISSWMLELARLALAKGLMRVYRRRLLLTAYLGLAFIAIQCVALIQLARLGLFMQGNPHASVFYVFAGAHGAHLAVGIGALIFLLFSRKATRFEHSARAESVALFWHFMGAIWVALFGLLLAWS